MLRKIYKNAPLFTTAVIDCVTGDARQRRTLYEADQDFERFGKTLTANFKDTATL